MAEIRPFHALRYDVAQTALSEVLTQPYDKISPAMQQAYYERHPFNLIRFELGKKEPADNDSSNAYTRAKQFLSEALAKGAILRDAKPAIYAYSQSFENPVKAGERIERRGFIALGKLHEYEEGVVHRHEQTLAGPKVDRANLLAATRTHSGQIFMLYEDPQQTAEKALWTSLEGRKPEAEVTDEFNVDNRLWRVDDEAVIKAVTEAMRDKKLIIADGHHRYETALRYRNAQGAQGGAAAHDFLMMTFVNMSAPGLIVLPTHRLVFGVENFDAAALVAKLGEFFEVKAAQKGSAADGAVNEIASAPGSLAMLTVDGGWILTPKRAAVDAALAAEPALRRKLDVVVLHKIILEKLLGLSEESISQQKNIHYHRTAAKAVEELRACANCLFLLNATPVEAMRDLSYSGEVMPQKSTDFYPKLLSGITLYNLDEGFAK